MVLFVNKYKNLLNHLTHSIEGYKQCAAEIALGDFKDKFKLLENSRQNLFNKCINLDLPINNMESNQELDQALPDYFDIQRLIRDTDADNIIVEIKRGESALMKSYEETLKCADISPHIRFSLEKQFIIVQSEMNYLNFKN